MIRKFAKKLLAPIILEVMEEKIGIILEKEVKRQMKDYDPFKNLLDSLHLD